MANSKKLKKQSKPKQLPAHVEKKREQERAAAKKAKRSRIWKRIGIAAGAVVLVGGIAPGETNDRVIFPAARGADRGKCSVSTSPSITGA